MLFKKGSFRTVLVLNNIVIKFPRNLKGILVNINEYYNWLRYKDLRHLLAPTYISIFGIINISKAVELRVNHKDLDRFCSKVGNLIPHPILSDISLNNIGLLNGRVVKLDYGNDFWISNIFYKIKNL